MPPSKGEDSFAQLDGLLLHRRESEVSPWNDGTFFADTDLLRAVLSIPISQGESQESGRPAKALDAWVAQELRRSGFPEHAIWPRLQRPRVLPEGLGELEGMIASLNEQLSRFETTSGHRLRPTELRKAIRDVVTFGLGSHEAYILGDFYAKQIDVGMSSWQRGPDLIISTKTMFSGYRKNLKNRHEEAVGEVSSLRRRHPMAAMGYVYLVRSNILNEEGAYAILVDILTRLRRAGEMFDATLLLVADWDDSATYPVVDNIDQPAEDLDAKRFFTDIIDCVTSRTPISEHQGVRLRRFGRPVGGLPDDDAFELSDEFE